MLDEDKSLIFHYFLVVPRFGPIGPERRRILEESLEREFGRKLPGALLAPKDGPPIYDIPNGSELIIVEVIGKKAPPPMEKLNRIAEAIGCDIALPKKLSSKR